MFREGVVLREGDVSPEFDTAMRSEGVAAWDLETDGLDFRVHAIRTCQVYVPGVGTEIVKLTPGQIPTRLADVLATERVFKVFHHAPFDLRFMRQHWLVRARNVGCTKVMSKVVSPQRETHSLAPLALDYLGIALDKSERTSDWSAEELSESQVEYAANDVLHLLDLYRHLWKEALNIGVGDQVEQSFLYLPVRVETDLRDVGDVFAY